MSATSNSYMYLWFWFGLWFWLWLRLGLWLSHWWGWGRKLRESLIGLLDLRRQVLCERAPPALGIIFPCNLGNFGFLSRLFCSIKLLGDQHSFGLCLRTQLSLLL
jgi:hypothetical protein